MTKEFDAFIQRAGSAGVPEDRLFLAMQERLAMAMHEFNHSNAPRQMYWNGYHQAIAELHEDILKIIKESKE